MSRGRRTGKPRVREYAIRLRLSYRALNMPWSSMAGLREHKREEVPIPVLTFFSFGLRTSYLDGFGAIFRWSGGS